METPKTKSPRKWKWTKWTCGYYQEYKLAAHGGHYVVHLPDGAKSDYASIVIESAPFVTKTVVAKFDLRRFGEDRDKALRWLKRFCEWDVLKSEKMQLIPEPGKDRGPADRSDKQLLKMCLERKPPDRWEWRDDNGEADTPYHTGWYLSIVYTGPNWWHWHVHKRVGRGDWNPMLDTNALCVAQGTEQVESDAKEAAEKACRKCYDVEVDSRRLLAARKIRMA